MHSNTCNAETRYIYKHTRTHTSVYESLGLMFLERGIQSDSGLTCRPLSRGGGACSGVHKHTHIFAHMNTLVTNLSSPGVLAEKQAEYHRSALTTRNGNKTFTSQQCVKCCI